MTHTEIGLASMETLKARRTELNELFDILMSSDSETIEAYELESTELNDIELEIDMREIKDDRVKQMLGGI